MFFFLFRDAFGFFYGILAEIVDHSVQYLSRAAAVDGRNGVGFPQPQRIEIRRKRLVDRTVYLVHHQQHMLFAAAQDLGYFLVHRRDTGLCVGHKDDDRSLLDGQMDLLGNLVLEYIVRAPYIASGVYHRKFHPVPVAFAVMAVTGNPRYRIHDSLPGLGQAVEKRRFAHVRAAYYCQYICHFLVFFLIQSRSLFSP